MRNATYPNEYNTKLARSAMPQKPQKGRVAPQPSMPYNPPALTSGIQIGDDAVTVYSIFQDHGTSGR